MASTSAAAAIAAGDVQPDYRYLQEISQMMFVFGNIVDPHPDVLKVVEDIVRNQVIEMLLQSRALSARRGSRHLSPEDLIFLIRYDRAKVNRLRTYLSWKDVRKNAKESSGEGGAGADVGEGGDDAVDNPIRSRKMKIKLPWELATVYSEHLGGLGGEEREEEDDDDIEAHEDSLQRLKDADEATRRMTRDEYVHYSECRQASFTFRKGKKFREFINAGAYLDVKPNDDIIDVLGFLAFEVVRELTVGAVALKQSFEDDAAQLKRLADGSRKRREMIESGQRVNGASNGKTKAGDSGEASRAGEARSGETRTQPQSQGQAANDAKRTSPEAGKDKASASPASKRQRLGEDGARSGSAMSNASSSSLPGQGHDNGRKSIDGKGARPSSFPDEPCGLFVMPPAKSSPLLTSHVREAFARLQRGRGVPTGGGIGRPAGGLRRTRVFVI